MTCMPVEIIGVTYFIDIYYAVHLNRE
jgi:hypothetical protein